jgi:hypothetical protein
MKTMALITAGLGALNLLSILIGSGRPFKPSAAGQPAQHSEHLKSELIKGP